MEDYSARDVFDSHADVYAAKFMDVSAYGSLLDEFLRLVPKDARLLELGCGPGNVTRYLLDRRPDVHITATDIAPKMIELCKSVVPEATHLVMDCRQPELQETGFDAIVIAFVLPYLRMDESRQLMQWAAGKVRENGVLYLSTMEGTPDRCGIRLPSSGQGPGTYMSYYTESWIQDTLHEAGFHTQVTERVQVSEDADTDLIVICRTV